MNGESIKVIDLQQPFNQSFTLLRDIAVDVFKTSLSDLFEELGLALGAEGVVALQHHVEEDA